MARFSMRYDLSSQAKLPQAQSRRQVLWVGRGMIVAFSVVLPAELIYGYYAHHGFTNWIPGIVLLLAIASMMIAAGTVCIRTARTVAMSVEVDAQGFQFDFGDSRPWRAEWRDPRLRLQLVKFSPTDGTPPSILAAGSSAQRAYLTPEAFDELVRQASANGLRAVQTRPATSPSAVLTTISP
jgi:hypothetical protein